jgi:hypothetical protein
LPCCDSHLCTELRFQLRGGSHHNAQELQTTDVRTPAASTLPEFMHAWTVQPSAPSQSGDLLAKPRHAVSALAPLRVRKLVLCERGRHVENIKRLLSVSPRSLHTPAASQASVVGLVLAIRETQEERVRCPCVLHRAGCQGARTRQGVNSTLHFGAQRCMMLSLAGPRMLQRHCLRAVSVRRATLSATHTDIIAHNHGTLMRVRI